MTPRNLRAEGGVKTTSAGNSFTKLSFGKLPSLDKNTFLDPPNPRKRSPGQELPMSTRSES